MTEWTPEEDEAFNMVERNSNLGKQILREIGQPYHFQKREWVGLTDEDYKVLREGVVKQDKPIAWMIEQIEAKLKEKNEKT
jgi:hypothetical protein